MALAANSYGSLAKVGVLVPKWSGDGAFGATTRPASGTVETWLDQVSGIVNSYLAREGFQIPVTNSDVVSAIECFVCEEVAAMVNGINGSGRFGPTTKNKGNQSRFQILMDDADAFIKANAIGFARLGATRTSHLTTGFGYRGTDESGDDVFPIRQRKEFGNTFSDWDS